MKTGFFREVATAGNKEYNDRIALLLWHNIQRTLGKKEDELDTKIPNYSLQNLLFKNN